MKFLIPLFVAALLGAAATRHEFATTPVVTTTVLSNTPVLLQPRDIVFRYGNWLWPAAPAEPPKFTERDIIGRNTAQFKDTVRSTGTNIAGAYKFPPRQGAHQVVWIANSLGTNWNFNISGFSWGTYPSPGNPWQTLRVAGVEGTLWISSDVNSGGYTLNIK